MGTQWPVGLDRWTAQGRPRLQDLGLAADPEAVSVTQACKTIRADGRSRLEVTPGANQFSSPARNETGELLQSGGSHTLTDARPAYRSPPAP